MLNPGSMWQRWDPHIHAPGTLNADEFGNNAWEKYISLLETSEPKISALGITDYYVTDTYEEVLRYKSESRLPDVDLIFPNIEVRLNAATKRGGFVNLHLLANPTDADHVEQLQRFLAGLKFRAFDDSFGCTKSELIRLGKKSDSSIIDNRAALKAGALQYKVSFDNLRDTHETMAWARNNILIAVAGGSGDGSSGLSDVADKVTRAEIEKFAHIIFSANPKQRTFWTGQGACTEEEIRERYGSCKPCLHGSDAHELAKVAKPELDRRCWIKGDATFEALQQAYIDPYQRAFVGAEPPKSTSPSEVIHSVKIDGADWLTTPSLRLNPGLVAIIGARGSGKTALADILACACDAFAMQDATRTNAASFLTRAGDLLQGAEATVEWADGQTMKRSLSTAGNGDETIYPRVRYLSQQFVENLCSSEHTSDLLLAEIERILFEAHAPDQREGAVSFSDLRETQTFRARQSRYRLAADLDNISKQIAEELYLEKQLAGLTAAVTNKAAELARANDDLSKMVINADPKAAQAFNALSDAIRQKGITIGKLNNQRESFLSLQDEVKSMRDNKAPHMLKELKAQYEQSGLNDDHWAHFKLDYTGDVDQQIAGFITWSDKQIIVATGSKTDLLPPATGNELDLTQLTMHQLLLGKGKVEKQISHDKQVRERYSILSRKVQKLTSEHQALEQRRLKAAGAAQRRNALRTRRNETYRATFQAIVDEQTALTKLYAPLQQRLSGESGTLGKLQFKVERTADTAEWSKQAEGGLLDLRKGENLKGVGGLTREAMSILHMAWSSGSALEAETAMKLFVQRHSPEIMRIAKYNSDDNSSIRSWSENFAQWLYDTTHIQLRYTVTYDGISIDKLSPGTRGIVLLLLYLALDEKDTRPLIIDQPEENLDPKSVFDELVPLFTKTKERRQVIIITHNANLVVNTDADQVIVANIGQFVPGKLPPITYVSGGLEIPEMRKEVCSILEGGDEAFKERARRLRLVLSR